MNEVIELKVGTLYATKETKQLLPRWSPPEGTLYLLWQNLFSYEELEAAHGKQMTLALFHGISFDEFEREMLHSYMPIAIGCDPYARSKDHGPKHIFKGSDARDCLKQILNQRIAALEAIKARLP